jgi:hypothetical protein
MQSNLPRPPPSYVSSYLAQALDSCLETAMSAPEHEMIGENARMMFKACPRGLQADDRFGKRC